MLDGDSLTYSISGSEINISSSGVLTFATAPDYETKNSYTATVTVSDGTDSVTQNITVNVLMLMKHEAPTISSSATFSAAENQTAIGSVTATDVDGDSLTYSISGSEINISSSGVLTFATAPDYETKNSYTATVTVSDGTDSVTQNITVNVTDVNENEAPTISSSATFSAAENQTAIGSVTATDVDGDSLTYSISGSEINISSSGVLTFATAPDYETKNSYTATVTVSDGTASTTQDITANITDVNETPYLSQGTTFTINENETSVDIGSTVIDEDGDTVTFSLGDGGSALFNISSAGVLTLKTGQNFDYESRSEYSFQIGLSDGSLSYFPMIAIRVNDLNEAPTISSSATFSAAENQTAIGSVTATDVDGDSLTYSISGSEINISSSGVLTFATAPDYETKNSYTATVTVSDGTASTTQNITVNVGNLNDNSPVFSGDPPNFWWWIYEEQNEMRCSLAVNSASCTDISATDLDGDTVSYAISNITGIDNSEISINSTSGLITLSNADYDSGITDIRGTVTASDGVNSVSDTFRIELKDANDVTYYLYADNGPYLGCIAGSDCDSTNTESLCNDSGVYGNPSSTSSIWYPYSGYGATNNIYSPWYRGSNDTKPDVYRKENGSLVLIDKTENVPFFLSIRVEFYINNSVNGSHSDGRQYACSNSYWSQ